jgi:hypothetical protein
LELASFSALKKLATPSVFIPNKAAVWCKTRSTRCLSIIQVLPLDNQSAILHTTVNPGKVHVFPDIYFALNLLLITIMTENEPYVTLNLSVKHYLKKRNADNPIIEDKQKLILAYEAEKFSQEL